MSSIVSMITYPRLPALTWSTILLGTMHIGMRLNIEQCGVYVVSERGGGGGGLYDKA